MNSSNSIFQRFEDLTVLIVGDVMIDRYLYGRVDRISPEAPVPVVQMQREENRLGGAANVALNVSALGAKSILCSVIGTDENAAQFLELLPGQGLSDRGILQSSRRPTTVKTRVIAHHQQLMRVDREEIRDLDEEECNGFVSRITQITDNEPIDLIIFQDYNKGVLSHSVIEAVLALAREQGIPTAVDPKKENFWSYRKVTLFKPNLKEVRDSLPFSVDSTAESLRRAADYIREQLDNEYTMITLSEKGIFIADQRSAELIPTRPRTIADVCGAGDTVISVAAMGRAIGLEMGQVALLANLAGGQVCERVGVVPVHRVQLASEYQLLLQEQGSTRL